MSNISLEGNASGTGTFTIAAPNTSSNFTLTLPQASGTIALGTGLTGVTDSASPFETALGTGAGGSNTGVNNTFVGYNTTEINVINQSLTTSDNNNALVIDIFDYTNTSAFKMCQGFAITDSNSARGTTLNMVFGTWRSTAAITGVSLPLSSGTYSGGTYILYGVN